VIPVMQVGGMRHPLLLQKSLAPLPEAPSAASNDVELSYLDSFLPGVDVPSQASNQESSDAGSEQVSHTPSSGSAVWSPPNTIKQLVVT